MLIQQSSLLQGRAPVEVFYSRPVEARHAQEADEQTDEASGATQGAILCLLTVVQRMVREELERFESGGVAEGLSALTIELGDAVMQMLRAGADFTKYLPAELRPPGVGTSSAHHLKWTAQPEARGALVAIAEACLVLHQELGATVPSLAASVVQVLREVSNPILDGCKEAMLVTSEFLEQGNVRADRHVEYVRARSTLLPALYAHALLDFKSLTSRAAISGNRFGGTPGGPSGGGGPPKSAFLMLLDQLETHAGSEAGYDVLADVLEVTGDSAERNKYMLYLKGSDDEPEDFSTFMFRRLIKRGSFSTVLDDLPDALNEELLEHLKAHPELKWLQQVRMQKYEEAGDTLASLAKDTTSSNGAPLLLSERQRLLSRSKLALLASDCGAEERRARLQELDSELRLCLIQGKVRDGQDEVLLTATELARACLERGRACLEAARDQEDACMADEEIFEAQIKGPGGVELAGTSAGKMMCHDAQANKSRYSQEMVRQSQRAKGFFECAFHVFLAQDGSFCQQNRSMLESAWRCAARTSMSWAQVSTLRQTKSDFEAHRLLQEQMVSKAAHLCYHTQDQARSLERWFPTEAARAVVYAEVQQMHRDSMGPDERVQAEQAALDSFDLGIHI